MNHTYNTFGLVLPTAAVDPIGVYKKALLNKVKKYPHLTMAGINPPFTTPGGFGINSVENAGPGAAITFGSAKHHDINYYNSKARANAAGIPTIDLYTEWGKAMKNIEAYAERTKPVAKHATPTFIIGGYEVEVYDNFFKIGNRIISRYPSREVFRTYSVEVVNVVRVIPIEVTKYFA